MKPMIRRINARLIDMQLTELEGYVDTLESTLKRQEKLLGERIDRATAGMSEEDKPWYTGDQLAEEIGEVTETLPRLMWSGAFVSLLSLFEHEMLNLARRDLRFNKDVMPAGLPSKHHKLRYTDDAVEYWKAKGIAFPESGKEWLEIKVFRDIRNQIAHEGGLQDGSPRSQAIQQYVTRRRRGRKKSLSFRKVKAGTREEVALTADFCREAATTMRKFFERFIPLLP